MKESVRAEQFLYVKQALQYVNGHAEYIKNIFAQRDSYDYILLTLSVQEFTTSDCESTWLQIDMITN